MLLSVAAAVCGPASSAPAEKRDDDVIGDRKPRDLRRMVGYAPMRLRPVDDSRFVVARRWPEPDWDEPDDKRSIRPM